MAAAPLMGGRLGLLNARAANEGLEGCFIGSCVDADAALLTPEVACRFCQLVLISREFLFCLLCQKVLDRLCSCEFFLAWPWLGCDGPQWLPPG